MVICDYLRFYGETQIGGINFVNAVAELGEPLMPFVGPEYLPLVAGMCSNDAEASVQALAQFVRLCVHEEPSPEDLYFFLGIQHHRPAVCARRTDPPHVDQR